MNCRCRSAPALAAAAVLAALVLGAAPAAGQILQCTPAGGGSQIATGTGNQNFGSELGLRVVPERANGQECQRSPVHGSSRRCLHARPPLAGALPAASFQG